MQTNTFNSVGIQQGSQHVHPAVSSVRSGWHWLSSKEKTETKWFYKLHESCLCRWWLEKQSGRKLNLLPSSTMTATKIPLGITCPCISLCSTCHWVFPLQRVLSHQGRHRKGCHGPCFSWGQGEVAQCKARQCINYNYWWAESAEAFKAACLKPCWYFNIFIK